MKTDFSLTLSRDTKLSVLKMAAAVALLVVASKISFQIGPVPLTMQTFAVALLGAILGAKRGFAAVCAFLAMGFVGLPVFATPLCGPAAFMGPTAGYLVVFPFAAAAAGYFASIGWTGKNLFRSFAAQCLVNLLIITVGSLWLSASIGLEKALVVGFVPFIAGAILKSVLAAAVLYAGTLNARH